VPLSDAEKQKRYRERKKAEAAAAAAGSASPDAEEAPELEGGEQSGPSPVTAAEPLGDDEETPDSPEYEPLSDAAVEDAARRLGMVGADAIRLRHITVVMDGVKQRGVPISDEDLDRIAVRLGTLLGLDESERRGEPEQTAALRIQRAVDYQRWLLRRGDDPAPIRSSESHGPDLKPELAKAAAKAAKHPGGWDG